MAGAPRDSQSAMGGRGIIMPEVDLQGVGFLQVNL